MVADAACTVGLAVFLLAAGWLVATGASVPRPPLVFWPWVLLGAGAQIAATALMLAAMAGSALADTYVLGMKGPGAGNPFWAAVEAGATWTAARGGRGGRGGRGARGRGAKTSRANARRSVPRRQAV